MTSASRRRAAAQAIAVAAYTMCFASPAHALLRTPGVLSSASRGAPLLSRWRGCTASSNVRQRRAVLCCMPAEPKASVEGDEAVGKAPMPAGTPVPSVAGDTEVEASRRQKYKNLSVALLIMQNSFITLLTKSTRTLKAGSIMYIGSAAVFASELVKLPVCLAMLARDKGGVRGAWQEIYEKVVLRWRDTLLMGVPALCYCFQNVLFFVALSNLSATSYQLWSQSKTLTTALFFVLYIGGVLRPIQWVALGLLSMGVGLVQYSDVNSAAAAAGMNPLLGVSAVLLSSFLSGFANVYLEKMMKKSDASLWIRNVQLALFSIPQLGGCMALALFIIPSALPPSAHSVSSLMSTTAALTLTDLAKIKMHGLFVGFTPAVWLVVVLKALGGLIVAAVIKYADNILKTYATAIAIVVTCLLSIPLYGTIPSLGFLQGMTLVIASILLYNKKPRQPAVEAA